MYKNTISYFNIFTSSQTTFEIDSNFPKYINLSLTVKNRRLMIIGEKNAFEFYLAGYSLSKKA